jgi:hypothetical protein
MDVRVLEFPAKLLKVYNRNNTLLSFWAIVALRRGGASVTGSLFNPPPLKEKKISCEFATILYNMVQCIGVLCTNTLILFYRSAVNPLTCL